jgi:hypothetical protein
VTEFTASNTASCTIAISRAWANGLRPAVTVRAAIAFQSRTTSARAAAGVDTTQIRSTADIRKMFRPADANTNFCVDI